MSAGVDLDTFSFDRVRRRAVSFLTRLGIPREMLNNLFLGALQHVLRISTPFSGARLEFPQLANCLRRPRPTFESLVSITENTDFMRMY